MTTKKTPAKRKAPVKTSVKKVLEPVPVMKLPEKPPVKQVTVIEAGWAEEIQNLTNRYLADGYELESIGSAGVAYFAIVSRIK